MLKLYIYKDEVIYNVIFIDFLFVGDDNCYKLIVFKFENNIYYKIV